MAKSKLVLVKTPPMRAPTPLVPPPDHLDAEGKAHWTAMQSQYLLADASALMLLQLHCESMQEAREYRRQIAIDGRVLRGRQHPLIPAMHRVLRLAMGALRALELEDEADAGPRRNGRPPGTRRGI